MDPALIVPSVEAALEVAKFVQQAYQTYQAGGMTEDQLRTAWAQVGVGVQSANAAWEAAGKTTAAAQNG